MQQPIHACRSDAGKRTKQSTVKQPSAASFAIAVVADVALRTPDISRYQSIQPLHRAFGIRRWQAHRSARPIVPDCSSPEDSAKHVTDAEQGFPSLDQDVPSLAGLPVGSAWRCRLQRRVSARQSIRKTSARQTIFPLPAFGPQQRRRAISKPAPQRLPK